MGPIPANTGETTSVPTERYRLRAYPREHGGNQPKQLVGQP